MSKEIELAEKSSINRFDFLKEVGVEHIKKLSLIKVTDDTSEAIATQQYSNAKSYVAEIESLRVIVKQPYLEISKKIDEAAKGLKQPVTDAMEVLGVSLFAFKQEKKRLADIEIAEANAIQAEIIKYQEVAIAEINKCANVKELSVVFKNRIIDFPADETWGKFTEDALNMKNAIIVVGKFKKQQIVDFESAPDKVKAEMVENQQMEAIEKINEVTETTWLKAEEAKALANMTKPSGTRKDWKFKVINRHDIPERFLMVDEKAVNEYMREQIKLGRFEKGNNYHCFGFMFKQEESLSIK
jgi:hypothetical protein